MQKHITGTQPTFIPQSTRIARLVFKLEYWHEALMDIRAERREIIECNLPEESRNRELAINSDLTRAIRMRLSEVQHDHAQAIKESAHRIAEGLPTLSDDKQAAVASNADQFDAHGVKGGAE